MRARKQQQDNHTGETRTQRPSKHPKSYVCSEFLVFQKLQRQQVGILSTAQIKYTASNERVVSYLKSKHITLWVSCHISEDDLAGNGLSLVYWGFQSHIQIEDYYRFEFAARIRNSFRVETSEVVTIQTMPNNSERRRDDRSCAAGLMHMHALRIIILFFRKACE